MAKVTPINENVEVKTGFLVTKLTLQEVMMALEALNQMMQIDLPAKTAYWIARNADSFQKEQKIFNKVRDEKIKKYGEEDENKQVFLKPFIEKKDENGEIVTEEIDKRDDKGNIIEGEKDQRPVMIENPNFPLFQKEITDLLEQEVEIKYVIVPIEAFEKINLKPSQLQSILFMLGDE